MNRYALASTLPPSCNKLASSIPRRMTRRKETWTWTGGRRERDRAYPTPDHTYPLSQREKKKKRAIFFPFIRGRAGGESTPPLLFLRPLRGTWSVSQKSRFYRPISRGAGSLRLPARARTHPHAYTYADTHTHTHARVRARAHHASAGWSRPRVIITYTGYTRDEGNDDSRNGPRSEKGPRRREIACPPVPG